ncbi:MAG TPA: UDP-3-O-(3-hydroxymyristoyl)glucosamine N-acyltransferase [Xanthobacteraceae bacterium]|jgi:UDP-3-O-[3-hydroxymyristoyl] glucosamine N-acyltransferase
MMRLRDIAAALSAPHVGDGNIEIRRITDPAGAVDRSDLALAMTRETALGLAGSKARAAVVAAGAEAPLARLDALITVEHPRAALAILTALFDQPARIAAGIHQSAIVAPDAEIAGDVRIGPLSVIGSRARIGAGTTIHAHVTVGADTTIGRDCLLHPGVRIGDRVTVGDRAILQHNASIGADGFSYVTPEPSSGRGAEPAGGGEATSTALRRIHSVGTVVLGDDVEVGANSAIDRATIAATRIGRNTKIDNLVQIAHNVVIGENCLICGMVGISGSVTIGDRVVLGGGVGIADHVTIGADAVIAAGSGVGSNVAAASVMAGYPAVPRERAFEQVRNLARLRTLFKEVGDMRERLAALERTKPA